MKNNTEYKWDIHAVYSDTEPNKNTVYDVHTHGLERFGLKNLAMSIVGRPKDAARIINDIAWDMVHGEHYNVNKTHLVDDASNGYKILHVFDLTEKKLHDDDVLFITYVDDKEITSPINGKVYKYIYDVENDGSAKWEEVGQRFSLPAFMRRELGIE